MNLFARDPKPTNVSRLEAELYKHGFRDDGYATALDPTAADDGHLRYSSYMTMGFNVHDEKSCCVLDFTNRTSEKAVEMDGYVHIDQLEAVCRALRETNQSANREIHIKARMTISTAVAVCEALREWRKK